MMTEREIHKLVEDYIGTDGGYLCGFSYSKHDNFYVRYCDMDVDVPSIPAPWSWTRAISRSIARPAPQTPVAIACSITGWAGQDRSLRSIS